MNSISANKYQSVVVAIGTPYTTGIGFYLGEQQVIVTNEHIVRDNNMVVINHPDFGKNLAEVIFSDPKRDLALLWFAKPFDVVTIQMRAEDDLSTGDKVWAFGGTRNGKEHVKNGSIKDISHEIDGISYLLHDAVLNIGDSGGPLLNENGELIGVNTFIRKGGEVIGLALPVSFIREALEQMRFRDGRSSCRCFQCGMVVYDDSPLKNVCPGCGESIQLPSLIPDYQPIGIAATIEALLSEAAPQIELSRKGPNCWQVQQGSAEINISYYEKNGLIVGDAHLCELPSVDNKALYAFLLKQNFQIENLTFSIKEGDIVLSLMIYDRYLNDLTGRTLFNYLFEQADIFDNILVEKYGASWKTKV